MSESNNELLQKVQNAQPLFKTQELNEQAFKQQDVFKDQFKEQQQFKTVEEEATKESHEQQLASSFKVEEAEKIKEDGDDPQEPVPQFVSLNYSGISVTTADDKKMQAVKRAVDYYQTSKGDADEGLALEAVIKACKSFTWGKFSLFCSGKTKAKLKEVKKVREDAERALAEFKKKAKENNTEPIPPNDDYYAPRIEAYVYDKSVEYPEELTEADKEKQISDRAKEIQKKYHFDAARAKKVAQDEFENYSEQSSTSFFKERYMTKEEKMFFEVEEEVEKRFKDMSSVKRFFTRIFAKEEIRNKVMEETIKKMRFAFDFASKSEKPNLNFSKNESDGESTFI